MTRVFKKRYPKNLLHLSTGKSLPFEDFGDYGFLKTSDPVIINELELAMKASRGGVQESNESEYEEASKKKLNSPPSQLRWNEVQTSGKLSTPRLPQIAPAVALATETTSSAVNVESLVIERPKAGKRDTK